MKTNKTGNVRTNIILKRDLVAIFIVEKQLVLHIVRMCAALVIQNVMRMRHIIFCGLPDPTIFFYIISYSGPGSSVGIATGYRLGFPRSNSGADKIFRPSRPALGPTHPPVKWVPGLSRG